MLPRFSLFLSLLVFCFSQSLFASAESDLLAPLVIQNQGRLKPLDTFARYTLLGIYQKSKLSQDKLTAMEWMSELLLRPEAASTRKVFKVPYPEVIEALGLEPRFPNIDPERPHLYHFQELRSGMNNIMNDLQTWFQKEKEDRTLVEEQLIQLYMVLGNTYQTSISLSLFIKDISTDHPELAELFNLNVGEQASYLHFHRYRHVLRKEVTRLTETGKKERSDFDGALIRLISSLSQRIQDQSANNFTIIPPSPGSTSEVWTAPWQWMGSKEPDEWTWERLDQLQALFDQLQLGSFDEARKTASLYMEAIGHRDRIELELKYNMKDYFTKSLVFYIIAFLALMLSWMFLPKTLWWVSHLSICTGLALHGIGIGKRMVIMQRPPVSTLYESIIFVGFIAVLMCVILELIRRNGIGIFSGTILGTILHFVGFSYADDGDTMGMLVAVLDSNFWLATHVVTITMGYGATVVAGLVGHLYLIKAILHPQKKSDLQEIHKNAVGLSLVALLFTTLGTILGGIWADQSWGRFWGWDPKENGAMLIVLWLLMLLHGRISGIAKPLGFNAGLVLGNIIVALAWFGVNLLGVGLHSYGFTDSIAMNLAIFCGIEVLLAAVGYFWANARVSSTKPAEKAVTT